MAHKVAVAHTLFYWAETIYPDFPEKENEKKHVAQVLHNNGYPRGLVNKNWHPIASAPCNLDQDTPTDIVIHPYKCHMSETIRRILSSLGIRTCFWPHCTLRQTLVRVKDPMPPQCRAGVVHRIPCGTCPKVYIGQTGRTLEHRLKEHKRALTSGNVSQLVVAKHAMDASHTIKWKEAEVEGTIIRVTERDML